MEKFSTTCLLHLTPRSSSHLKPRSNDSRTNCTLSRLSQSDEPKMQVFFCTNCYVGLGTSDVEMGIRLFLFDGGLVTFIAYPLGENGFRLVRETYVFKVMDRDDKLANNSPQMCMESSELKTTIGYCAGKTRENSFYIERFLLPVALVTVSIRIYKSTSYLNIIT